MTEQDEEIASAEPTGEQETGEQEPVEEGEEVVRAPTKEDEDEEVVEVVDQEEESDGPKKKQMLVSADAPWKDRMWEVFSTFWPLGLVAFGGPQVRTER